MYERVKDFLLNAVKKFYEDKNLLRIHLGLEVQHTYCLHRLNRRAGNEVSNYPVPSVLCKRKKFTSHYFPLLNFFSSFVETSSQCERGFECCSIYSKILILYNIRTDVSAWNGLLVRKTHNRCHSMNSKRKR